MAIVYSETTTKKLQLIAAAHDITVEQAAKVLQTDIADTGHNPDDVVNWLVANPATVESRIDEYNTKNTATPIKPGAAAAKQKQLALLVAALVLVAVLGFVAWKKFIN